MRATWYVLEDGTAVDPSECAPDDKGVLRHRNGVAVAMAGDAHASRGVDVDESGKVSAVAVKAKPEKKPKAKGRELKAGKGRAKYETR